jgi:uracil-DNA glycosylase
LARDPRRYLAIQKELGGNEVILSAASPPGAEGSEAIPGLPQPQAPTPDDGGSAPRKHWSVDAPTIPTVPGIVVPPRMPGLADESAAWSTLEEVARVVAGCTRCFLSQNRKNPVPGEGNPHARLMFVGEGPGQTEDETGRPFVGRAGELLTRMIEAIGLKREDVYIANVVKNRPPQNRKPLPDEIIACMPYLERQIELIGPRVLVALGATAAEALLSARQSLTNLRGRVHSFRGIPLVVTYHPAALLRNPNWKKPTWDDVRIARQLLDR